MYTFYLIDKKFLKALKLTLFKAEMWKDYQTNILQHFEWTKRKLKFINKLKESYKCKFSLIFFITKNIMSCRKLYLEAWNSFVWDYNLKNYNKIKA